MGTREKPKPSQGEKTPPPLGPAALTDTPPPAMYEGPHSPAAADLPEGETQPIAANYGKAQPSKQR